MPKKFFKLSQAFDFIILTGTIQEPNCQTIVRKYSIPGDPLYGNAQKLYADLSAKFEGGTAAFLQAKATETALLGMTLSNNNNSTICAFLTSFKHRLLDFDKYRAEPASDARKKEQLDSALLLHPKMNEHVASLQTQSEIFRNQLGADYQPMDFDA
jgi:hypothetical protein